MKGTLAVLLSNRLTHNDHGLYDVLTQPLSYRLTHLLLIGTKDSSVAVAFDHRSLATKLVVTAKAITYKPVSSRSQ